MITKYDQDRMNDNGWGVIPRRTIKIDKKAVWNLLNENCFASVSSWGSLIVGTIISLLLF